MTRQEESSGREMESMDPSGLKAQDFQNHRNGVDALSLPGSASSVTGPFVFLMSNS